MGLFGAKKIDDLLLTTLILFAGISALGVGMVVHPFGSTCLQ